MTFPSFYLLHNTMVCIQINSTHFIGLKKTLFQKKDGRTGSYEKMIFKCQTLKTARDS